MDCNVSAAHERSSGEGRVGAGGRPHSLHCSPSCCCSASSPSPPHRRGQADPHPNATLTISPSMPNNSNSNVGADGLAPVVVPAPSGAASASAGSRQGSPLPPADPLMARAHSSPIATEASLNTASFRDIRLDQGANSSFSFLAGSPSALEQEKIQTDIENLLLSNLSLANEAKEKERADADAREFATHASSSVGPAPAFDLRELVGFFTNGMEVIVQDGFSRCFESSRNQPWNWNLYLWPLWICGVGIRWGILFPLRLTFLIAGLLLVFLCLPILKLMPLPESTRCSLQRKLIRFLCGVFVFSWTGVIKYHGRIPSKKPNQIYVANHTSMIDVIVLSQMNTFSLVGQKHPGWIGFMQTHVLGIIGTVWFQRGEATDRTKSAKKMKEHIQDPASNRLLVFPEGTCVNNEYCVQFKQGVFDMGAEVCPIAIKYNKIFVDAFWNSKAQSFQGHLATLMSSWAVVCDVYYLEPQRILPGENGIAFSNRVKKLIADKAGLRNVGYDGYLKHFEVKQSLVQKQQKMYAEVMLKRLTKEEKAQIESERAREESLALAAAQAARMAMSAASASAEPLSATSQSSVGSVSSVGSSVRSSPEAQMAGPDSLALSPSPDAPQTSGGLKRSGSDQSRNNTGGLAAVSSTANLIELLNAKQEDERKELAAQQQLRQRK